MVNRHHAFARWRYWITKNPPDQPCLHSLSSDTHVTHVMVGSNASKAASPTQRGITSGLHILHHFTRNIYTRKTATNAQIVHKQKFFILPSSICHYANVMCSRTIGKIPSPTFIKLVELLWYVLRFQSDVHMLHSTIITQICPR